MIGSQSDAQLQCTDAMQLHVENLIFGPWVGKNKTVNWIKPFQAQVHEARTLPRPSRRVWDLIVFGFEMDMLRLHMRVLESIVAGFLVTESTRCFQTRKEKRALLTEALNSNSSVLPRSLAALTAVKVVTDADGKRANCVMRPNSKYSTRCFQNVQRLALLDLLFAHADADDLAFVSDVDEIAKPSFVQLMRACAPFPPLKQWREDFVGSLIGAVAHSQFGLHCVANGNTWSDGPRLYVAGWLSQLGTVSVNRISPPRRWKEQLPDRLPGPSRIYGTQEGTRARTLLHRAELFDLFRKLDRRHFPSMSVEHATGWHLSSFGTSEELRRKLTTFGASSRFDPMTLNKSRLTACMRICAALLVSKRLYMNRTTTWIKKTTWINGVSGHRYKKIPSSITYVSATPCDEQTADAKQATIRAKIESKLKRVEIDFQYASDDARQSMESLVNGVDPRLWTSHANTQRLVEKLLERAPSYLLHHVDEFPASWFIHLAGNVQVHAGPLPKVEPLPKQEKVEPLRRTTEYDATWRLLCSLLCFLCWLGSCWLAICWLGKDDGAAPGVLGGVVP